jgi:hypothetical protein
MSLLAQFPQQAAPGVGGGALLGGLLCGLVIGVAIGTLIGAVILRAACWLYNKIAGGPNSASAVPEPDFGKAILICFVTALVNSGIQLVLGLVASQMGAATNLISLPISFIVMAAMLTSMLPTTFGRGLLVALLEFVVIIVVCLILGVLFALVFGVGFLHNVGR